MVDLVRHGKITRELAERRSYTPDEFKRLLGQAGAGGGMNGTSMPMTMPAPATAPNGGA
jgi:hypothetical protein